MLRLRLASLALASGLLVTLSGCAFQREDGRLFPRLFQSNYMHGAPVYGGHGECECHSSHMPQMMDSASMSGPFMPTATGQTMPIPITNSQPPQIFKVPQASPTPYVPAH